MTNENINKNEENENEKENGKSTGIFQIVMPNFIING